MTQYGDHTGVEKLQLSSKDWTSDHVAKIAELFPQVITESQDKHGRLRKAIDFDKLKDILSFDLAEGRETYEFTWVGKRDAMAEAGRPTTKTLRPDLAESVNFDETENVFITGDNLEVLKILQESYLNKIDIIYIDPPYNTGKDFVYSDKFQMSQEEMDEATESLDETGQRLVKNEKSNARYHSDWLNMMYPRLVLARNLLKESGTIFISIDDNEQANLKALCDEVFGEENFVCKFDWRKKTGANDAKDISIVTESVLLFGKNSKKTIEENIWARDENSRNESRFNREDHFVSERGKYYLDTLDRGGLGYIKSLDFGIKAPNGKLIFPNDRTSQLNDGWRWKWGKDKVQWGLQNDYFEFTEAPNRKAGYTVRLKNYQLVDNEGKKREEIGRVYSNLLLEPINQHGNIEVKNLFDGTAIFSNPKPVGLIKYLLKTNKNKNLRVLDFFAGSATTADAVMQLNAEDRGKRKFILCTLDEVVADKSAAKEAGYETIDQISRERIRRAADKIRTETPEKAQNLDFGFKAFKLDTSNFKEVYQSPEQYQQVNLLDNISNIKDDRNDLDLLFQVMLTWGMELSLSVKKEQLAQSTIYNVAENALIACFAEDITDDVIRQIAQKEPLRAVFKDSSFANSSNKINLSQIFKEVSPMTKVKVI
ncbi:site-specific DNA-methyltransferase [Streptococcus uberis]|uniref:site-specific DNA-methyltransferase n=1 Tax=Streptococcus uberis TaxID=1349 RepID=UPI003D6BF6EA